MDIPPITPYTPQSEGSIAHSLHALSADLKFNLNQMHNALQQAITYPETLNPAHCQHLATTVLRLSELTHQIKSQAKLSPTPLATKLSSLAEATAQILGNPFHV